MKWIPDKLGAEPRKIAILVVLGLAVAYLAWTNLFSGASSPSSPQPAARGLTPYANVEPEPAGPVSANAPEPPRRAGSRTAATLEDFKPSMKRARQIAMDPTHVDPTIRLDLLARLQNAKFEGDMRSLFEFSGTPALAVKEPKPIHPKPIAKMFGPNPLPPPQPPPAPPPPPPIPLKFYGFVNPARPDIKSAFFMEGEDILVGAEGQTIHNRYRIVRIGVNSAVVEDLQYKNQQTLPLIAEETTPG